MADRFSVSCPNCGLGVELETGILGWKSVKCPKCREKITYEKSRMKIVRCRGCDNEVIYDLARKNACPICRRELIDDDEEHISVICQDCGVVTELEKGVFGWRAAMCPQCGKKMRMKDVEEQLVECPSCRRSVVYSLKRRNNCPACNGPLRDAASQLQRFTIGCPVCQVNVAYAVGDTHAQCPSCGHGFDPTRESERLRAVTQTRDSDIRMTGDLASDQLVWRHPQNLFPLSARIIAKAGMTAVVVQGDSMAFAVNGQSVMLSETRLKADAYHYGENKDEKYVYAEVYYVRNAIPAASFAWGGKAMLLGSYNDVHAYAVNGVCELAPIMDHAAFLRWVRFDADVRADAFALRRDANGVETVGEYAKAAAKAMRAVYGEALRCVRDRRGVMPSLLSSCEDEIVFEVQRLANAELSKWGVALQTVVLNEMKYLGVDVHADPLRLRVEGGLNWQTEEIPVHLKDDAQAMACLKMTGSLYIAVIDEGSLKSSTAAARWSSGGENTAREEIGRHTGELLGSMFASVFQKLVDDMSPPLDMLSTYAGYLKAQAEQLLNSPTELLSGLGLNAQQLTLNVKVVSKSPLYALRERTQLTISESEIREKLYEYEEERRLERARRDARREIEDARIRADTAAANFESRQKISGAQADAEIAEMANRARVTDAAAKLRHSQHMAEMAYAAEEDETRRKYSFDAWQQEARAEAVKEREMFDSLRRRSDYEQAAARDHAMHEKAMHDVMRAVEESDQTWREKLDAYARLQRNLATQDAIDQQSAKSRMETDAEIYEGYERLHLDEETRRLAAALDKEAALLQEEMEKARFTRDLELRRQSLAEEMQRLTAAYEQERARLKLESENERLRQMLEYMAKASEHQTAQDVLKTCIAMDKGELERIALDEREASERQRADELRREQNEREERLAARAHELTKEMLAARNRLAEMEKENERAYESGRAMAEAKGCGSQDEKIETLIEEVASMGAALREAKESSASLTIGSDLTRWLESLIRSVPADSSASGAYSAHAAAPETRRCPYCQYQMPLYAVICPTCRRT